MQSRSQNLKGSCITESSLVATIDFLEFKGLPLLKSLDSSPIGNSEKFSCALSVVAFDEDEICL